MSGKSVGARVLRSEDPRLLRGRGAFVDDIRLPGMLHAAFVRAHHAHARVRRIDTSRVLAIPGVHAVFTAVDMTPAMRMHRMPALVPIPYAKFPLTQFALAVNEVCYAGEPIAIVIADTRYIAEDAASAVEIDYEILPAASDCRDAVAENAPLAHLDTPSNEAALFKVGYGDIASAFRDAARVFTETLWHLAQSLSLANC